MKKIEEIKNEISRDLGNENFKELFKNAVRNMPIEKAFLKINDIINEASLIYANKCVKDSLKKASEKAEIIICEIEKIGENSFDALCKLEGIDKTIKL